MSESKLFEHFEGVSQEEWKDKIIQDLKGKDYDQTLVWTTRENLKVQPIYTPSKDEYNSIIRPHLEWQTIAPIQISDQAQVQALQNLQGGATGIHFIGNEQNVDVEALTSGIETSYAPISFQNVSWNESHRSFWISISNSNSHLGIDPLYHLHLGQSQSYDLDSILPWLQLRKELNASWGVLSIDGSIYKNSGGHFIDEIAFIIAALQENLHQLNEAGYASNEIGLIQIRTAIGPNFFFEIAKLKVIRQLAQIVAQQYEGAQIQILAESADIFHSQLDTPTNILRLTTEGMSAILGGADAVMLHTFDWKEDAEFAQRISRNIQHLLVEESYFAHQQDPTSGAYYIEQLIEDLRSPAWNVFLSIEKFQGYIHSFVGKSIPEFFIFRHKLALNKESAKKKTVLLGVNQYPNIKDILSVPASESSEALKTTILHTYRIAEPFEKLRWRMQQHQQIHGSTPKAYLLEAGNVTMRKARATFAFNFLATAGIPSMESTFTDEWEKNLEEIASLKPEIIVLCSDNDTWQTLVPKALETLPKLSLIILAGKSDQYPVDFIIYEGMDIVETLENILSKLKIA